MSDLTSNQFLGDSTVLVEFELEPINGKPNVTINGAFVIGESGGFVEASCFSADQLSRWGQSIQIEVLEGDYRSNTLARAAGKANGRRFCAEPEQHSAFGSLA